MLRTILLFLIFTNCYQFTCAQATTVEFIVNAIPTNAPAHVGIRGNQPPLNWETSIPLEKRGQEYVVSLEFAAAIENIEFKFVLYDNDNAPTWEGIENRELSLLPNEKITSINQWDVDQLVDISALPKVQPEALLQDYELIETMVLQVHPGTYRYNDKASIQKALAELKAKFQQPLTHGEAYLAMSKVTAAIQCDHTQVGFNNQNKTINSIIHRQADKLPFTFRWIGDKMIVLADATKQELLPKGTEILAIAGVQAAEIQASMLPYIGVDGATDKSRLAKMSVEGYDFRYYPFDVFYPLLYPIQNQPLQLEVKIPDEPVSKIVQAQYLTREDRFQQLTQRYPDFPKTRNDLWDFKITEDNIGILTINSFGLYGWKRLTLDYKSFLADAFAQLKQEKVEHLVVDIRKNSGGNDEMKDELFKYFKSDNTRQNVRQREGRTRYLTFPENLKPHVQTWGDNPWFFNLRKPDRVDQAEGYYAFYENFDQKPQKRKSTAFTGSIYLLTSPTNVSLAFYLAQDFKKNKLGTIIGQETGGNLRDINGGQILFLRLPQSGIEIDFPVMGGFALGEQPNQGVQPNIEVQPSLSDIAAGIDTEMEAVMKIIRE